MRVQKNQFFFGLGLTRAGFDIPQTVLDNKKCDLSIALLIFYRAGGLGSTIVVEEWEKYEKN